MDDARTRKTLDTLADLFLTEASSNSQHFSEDQAPGEMHPGLPECPEKTEGKPVRLGPKIPQEENETVNDPVSVATHDGPHLILRKDKDDETAWSTATSDDLIATKQEVLIEAVVLGNLPVFARPWLAQYAHQLAQQRGPVGIVQIDAERVDLQLICTTNHTAQFDKAEVEAAVTPQSCDSRLNDLLTGMNQMVPQPVHTWLVHFAALPSDDQLIQGDRIKRWTLLSGADESAVAAAYQLLQRTLEQDDQRDLRQVGLAVMGSDEDAGLAAAARLNETLVRWLDEPLQLRWTLKQMVPVRQHAIGSFPHAGMLWPTLLSFFEEIAPGQILAKTSPPHQAALQPAASIVEPSGVSEPIADQQAVKPAGPGQEAPVVNLPLDPSTHEHSPDATTTGTIETQPGPDLSTTNQSETTERDPDLVQMAGRALEGAVVLDASCPLQSTTKLVLDQTGRLHLLHHHDRTLHEDIHGSVVALMEARKWVEQHRSLLQLTQRQCRFDDGAESHLHLFTEQAKSAIALIGWIDPPFKLHLLQRIEVGGQCKWVCNELN